MTLQQSADYKEQHASLPTLISATDADDQLKIIAIANGDITHSRSSTIAIRVLSIGWRFAFSNNVNKVKKWSKRCFGGYGGAVPASSVSAGG